MYDIFDNFFPIGFSKPVKFYFNTNGLKDQFPSVWERKEEFGYRATIKCLGIEKANVEVVEPQNDSSTPVIKVSGESEIEGKKYNTSVELPIAEDILANVTEIHHKTIAGLCIVDIYVKQPEKRKIKITEA